MITLLTAPSFEPVSLDAAKLACRIDGTEFDGLLPTLISAAREMAEHECGQAFAGATLRVELHDWPAAGEVLSVRDARAVAVSYWTGSGWAVFTGLWFGAEAGGTVVEPATAWPELGERPLGPRVRIDITVGPAAEDQAAATAAVPASVRTWILAQVAYWVRNPEAASDRVLTTSPLLAGLLWPHRRYG